MALSRNKILYIEDDPSTRQLIGQILKNTDYEYFQAATGLEGLQLAEEIQPDLILMDLNLPDISGTELATQIKSIPRLKEIIIVAITGFSREEAREFSLVAGCDGYLTKPIDVKAFPQQLDAFLQGKREEVAAEKREKLRKQYEESLVNRLTEKIKELQESNQLLKSQSEELQNYNRKLEILLQVIHYLQLSTSPEDLRERLLGELCRALGFPRTAFLEIDHEQMALQITEAHGFKDKKWQDVQIRYEVPLFQKLFRKHLLLQIKDLKQIPDSHTRRVLKKIGARRFLFGILGATPREASALLRMDSARQLFDNIIPTLYNQQDTDIEIISEHLQEYLSSEIFYIGGYVFIDLPPADGKLSPYDIRILEMLLRTAGLIYQNLRLREQLKKLFVRAEKDAITDHLTDLFNYRYFTQQLIRECNRARRHNSRFALLMLDIDFFKSYNDTFGHQAGDLVLKKVARLLQANTRSSDFVARYGGEEFMIICPELNKQEGKQLAEKLCRIIEETPFPQETKLPHKKITISIGVAVFPDDSQSPKELIHFSDIALYKAKNSGRNQVQLYENEDGKD